MVLLFRVCLPDIVVQQLHKPEAVVRFYREFIKQFGKSFAPPPARPAATHGGAGELLEDHWRQQVQGRQLFTVSDVSHVSLVPAWRVL